MELDPPFLTVPAVTLYPLPPPPRFPTSKIRDEGVVGVQGHGHWDVIPYLLKPEKPCGVSDTHLGPAEPGWVTLAKWHHHWLKEQV